MIKFFGRAVSLTWTVATVSLAFLVVLWIYWPGHYGPPLLDDRSSVLVITNLKDNPQRVVDYIFGDGSGMLGRPVSMATFVLERLLFGDSLGVSKLFNIYLHLLNALLFTLLLSNLLRSQHYRGAGGLAVCLGLCWTLAPLHVSTVLYAVQRMAMLSTTFMLLALLSYTWWRGRLSSGDPSTLPLILGALCIVAGLFAKENAIVVIPTLFLLESLWFQWRDSKGRVIHRLKLISLGGIAIGGIGLGITLLFKYEALSASFEVRNFTLHERLLTESRVLWDYLGQLLWPDLMRLGLYHDDFLVSKSLISPLSTLYAVLGWVLVLLVGAVLLRWPWGRRLAIGPAWYLVGHSVESSVLALELYFEHRNYFPVMGFYLSAGALFGMWFRKLPELQKPVLAYVLGFAFLLALQTSSQVQIWSQRELLVFNHLNGHPTSPRANTDMAVLMADVGDYARAREYSRVAFENNRGERQADFQIRDIALSCIAGDAVSEAQIDDLGKVNPERPVSSVTTLLTLVRMQQDGLCPDFRWIAVADRMVDLFLVDDFRHKAAPNVYSTLATLENSLGRFEVAYRYMQQYLAMLPSDTRGQFMQLHFTTALGRVDEAAELRNLLAEKQSRGELTVAEQENLALYTGAPPLTE
ncbi:hypothetical protein FV139_02110 [Parahaliea maris]|uniref:Tetratricopeptide repeat protein n=1 Tax=Parahaliea maris TaxID=2716870 RepID=A0A5C9A5W0_9GAMM|nr:hypothetical protein [Parahaliea maris]TXS96313.1 hypothetical protein FV139_02110 [Parahaliea maris]